MILINKIKTFLILSATILAMASCNLSKETTPSGGLVIPTEPNTFSVNVTNGVYGTGQTINFNFVYTESLTVDTTSGTPFIEFDLGGATVQANYVSGSGSSTIVFSYTVSLGEVDNDGISLSGTINLNGGSIEGASESAPTSYSSPNTSSVLVDAQVPGLLNLSIADALYYYNDVLSFDVQFDESVTVDTTSGTPRLVINLEGNLVYANYVSGSGSDTLNFQYTVTGSDIDLNGIQVASPVDLNGGTIKDAGNNNAALSFIAPNLSGVTVNGDIPVIISSNIPANGTYYNGQDLNFTVTYSESVIVSGNPRIALNIGGNIRYANYDAVNSSGAVVAFKHSIVSGDIDNDGIAIATPIDLNSGSISDGSNNAFLNIAMSGSGINIAFSDPQVAITNASTINLANHTAYSVSGTCSENSRDVVVQIGSLTVSPNPVCTSGLWSVTAQDISAQGDSASFTILADHNDAYGNNATQASTSVLKDTVAPTVTISSAPSINVSNVSSYIVSGSCSENGQAVTVNVGGVSAAVACSAGSYSTNMNVSSVGDGASISVTSDHVDVAGNNATQATTTVSKDTVAPTVAITSAPTINLLNDSNYVVAGTCDNNGEAVDIDVNGETQSGSCSSNAFSITVNASSVLDGTSVPVTATHTDAAGNSANHSVNVIKDTVAPVIAITSAPNILIANETGYIVSGTCDEASLAINVSIGGISTSATCDGANWAIASTDVSALADGSVSITANTTDSNGNAATQASVSVTKDSDGPSVTNIVLDTASGVYQSGTIQVTVTFSEDATFVTTGGTPSIDVVIGANTRAMTYVNQPTASTAVFSYTIGNELDMDGLAIGTSIVLNGGVIQDTIGNTDGDLTFTAPNASGIFITPAGLISWLDAGDSNYLYTDSSCSSNVSTNGDSVLCWKDKTGNGNNATQSNSGKAPLYTTGAINGSSALTFDGSDDHFTNSVNFAMRTVIVVFKSHNTSGIPQLYGNYFEGGHVAVDAANNYFSFNGNASGNKNKAKFKMDNDTGFSGWILDSGSGDSMWTQSQAHIVYTQFRSNSGISLTTNTIGIENPSTNANPLDGEIAEILVFDSALVNGDQTAIMDYLKAKYGI